MAFKMSRINIIEHKPVYNMLSLNFIMQKNKCKMDKLKTYRIIQVIALLKDNAKYVSYFIKLIFR